MVAVVSAALVGFGIYLSLNAIAISLNRPLRDARDLTSLIVLGLCCGLLALAGGVVSLVRARPRTVATLAVVAALVLPLIAAIVGAKFGMDSLVDHVLEKGATLRDDTALALAQTIEDDEFDLSALVQLLIHLMRA